MVENPFSSRYINPENSQFIAPASLNTNSLIQKSPQTNIMQIVGPHGCGKSTLAIQIARGLENKGEISAYRTIVLRGDKVSQLRDHSLDSNDKSELLIIDGIESLSMVHRTVMISALRSTLGRVILTAHRKIRGVFCLCELRPNLAHFTDIVKQLISNQDYQLELATIENAYQQNHGDYRLALMQLYDAWEILIR